MGGLSRLLEKLGISREKESANVRYRIRDSSELGKDPVLEAIEADLGYKAPAQYPADSDSIQGGLQDAVFDDNKLIKEGYLNIWAADGQLVCRSGRHLVVGEYIGVTEYICGMKGKGDQNTTSTFYCVLTQPCPQYKGNDPNLEQIRIPGINASVIGNEKAWVYRCRSLEEALKASQDAKK